MADTEALVKELGDFAEKRDFGGALALVRENLEDIKGRLQPGGVRDALKKTTDDRLLLAFLALYALQVLVLVHFHFYFLLFLNLYFHH